MITGTSRICSVRVVVKSFRRTKCFKTDQAIKNLSRLASVLALQKRLCSRDQRQPKRKHEGVALTSLHDAAARELDRDYVCATERVMLCLARVL